MNVYPLEPYPYWQQVLGEAEFPLGSFGEDAGPERTLRLVYKRTDELEMAFLSHQGGSRRRLVERPRPE